MNSCSIWLEGLWFVLINISKVKSAFGALWYRSGMVNSNTVNSKFHLIWSKTLPMNDFKLIVPDLYNRLVTFLGGLSLHLNYLIASHVANYDWLFGTVPFGLFGSNLDTRDLETYPRTCSGHFLNMSIFDDSRAIWVLFRKWVVSENQSFLYEGAIVTPLLV